MGDTLHFGRDAVVRYSTTQAAIGNVDGFISPTDLSTWLTASTESSRLIEVAMSLRTSFEDITPRLAYAAPGTPPAYTRVRLPKRIPLTRSASITFGVNHYGKTDADTYFNKWIIAGVDPFAPVGLMFLEEGGAGDHFAAYGNFYLVRDREEPLRGIQRWSIDAIADEAFELGEVTIP